MGGIKYGHLQNLVNFMYQGAVTIAAEELQSFLEITENLKIKGLSLSKEDHLSPDIKFAKRKSRNEEINYPLEKTVSDKNIHFNNKVSNSSSTATNENVNKSKENVLISNNTSEVNNLNTETKDFKIVNVLSQIIPSNENGDILEESLNTGQFIRTSNCNDNINSEIYQENTSTISLNNDKLFTCDKCEKQYTRSYHLERHKKSAHDKIRYSCDQCNHAPFKWRSSLTEHKVYHEGNGFQCDQCNHLPFRNSSYLKEHKGSAHDGVVHPCDQCDNVSFSKLNTLEKHKASVHEGVRFTCDQCDHLPYKSSNHLMKHKRAVHEGVCYPCGLCDYKASHKPNVQRHMERMHKKD